MQNSIQLISPARLALAFIPALATVAILYKWSLDFGNALYGIGRMLLQLLLVGYFLVYIFASNSSLVILAVLTVMVLMASWISLRSVGDRRVEFYTKALLAVFLGGGGTLVLITRGVLHLDPWFLPRYMIPLAGMIFASAMNAVSLAAERFLAELSRRVTYQKARGIALKASLIPRTNSLFAVGLVSLPGMMTGQILSGVSPLIAARYQIMVMCMIFGSAGISATIFLLLLSRAAASVSRTKAE